MQSSQEKYRAIFDTVSDAIIICDPETGRVLEVNQGMCEMFGYTPEEAQRLHLAALWSGATGEEGGLTVKGGTGSAQLWEIEARDRGGQSFWVEAHVRPAVLDGRERMVAVLRDIQARKRAEITRRKQGEEALGKSEAKYRTLVEQIPAITYICALDNLFSSFYISPQIQITLGFTPEEWQADPDMYKKQIHPDDRDRVLSELILSYSQGGPFLAEYRMLAKSGRVVWVRDESRAVYDRDGRPLFTQGVVMDITARQETEEALQAANNKLRTLVEASPLAIIAVDPEGRVMSWNPAAELILGWPQEEVMGRPVPQVLNRKKSREIIQRGLQGESMRGIERRVKTKAGMEIDILLFTGPLFDTRGNITGVVGVLEDITARKLAEAAAERIRRQQEAILSNIGDVAWLKDKECRYLTVNETFSRACGLKLEEVMGQTDLEIWPPDLAEKYRADDQEVMRTGKKKRLEEPLVTKNGNLVWVETIKSPIFNDRNEVVGTTGIARDITERRQMEETLRQVSRALKAITECHQAMLRASQEPELLQEICRIIVEVGGYRMAWVGLAEHDARKTIRPVSQEGFDEGYINQLHLTWADGKRGQGPTGTAIRHGKPAICRDTQVDPKFAPWREEARKRGFASVLALPLMDSQTFGALTIYAVEPHAFDDEEINLLVGLANDLAYGITALRARADHRRAEEALKDSEQKLRLLASQLLSVQERERRRVARELHDELGQALTVLKIHLAAIEDKLPKNQPALQRNCEQLLDYIDGVIENVRRLSWDLSPSILEDLGLSASLGYLIDEISRNNQMQDAVKMDQVDHLFSAETQINIYRIFQESLTNIVKHAHASQLAVDIHRQDNKVVFQLRDNGVGFDKIQALSREVSQKSLGLTAMKERALMANGTLDIWSRRGKGTQVTFTIPIDK